MAGIGTFRWQRPKPLPLPASARAALAVPRVIFAVKPADDNPSKRPLHTVEPLATDLGLKLHTDFAVRQEKDLLDSTRGSAEVVLICMHHERIPKLVAELSVEIEAWPDEAYDRVLVFDRVANDWKLSVVQQHLLPGG